MNLKDFESKNQVSEKDKNEIINFYSLGKLDKAQNKAEQLLKKFPKDPVLYNLIGAVLSEKNNLNEAIVNYKKSIEMKSDYAPAYNSLGVSLQQLEQFDEALVHYKQAIKILPNFAEAHNNLGALYRELNKFDEAILHCKKALEIKPNFSEAHNNLGLIFESADNLNDAISHYQEIIKLCPEQASKMYNKIGGIYIQLGNVEKAVASFQEGLIKRSGIDFEKEKKLRPATTYFFLELTNKCNFHCEFCPSDLQTRPQGFMDFSLVKKIFDEIAMKKIVTAVNLHLMGEPTLHPKLDEIFLYAKKKKIPVHLTTNGSTLVKKRVPRLLENISGKIVASLMTPTKETYKVRGAVGLSWDRYVDNFRLLVEEHLKRIAKKEKNEYNIVMRVMVSGERINKAAVKVLKSSTDIEENWNEWSNFVGNIEKQLGIKAFDRPKIDYDKVFSIISDTREASFDLQKGLKLQFWQAFTFANSRVSDDYELEYQQEAKFCPHPYTDFGILWNGDVNLCCLDHDATLKVGDVRNNSIETVIKSTAAKKLRDSMYGLEKLHPTCVKCQASPKNKIE